MLNLRALVLSLVLVPALALAGPVGPQPGTREDFLVNVGDRCLLDYDKAEATSKECFDTLARQVAWLNKYNWVTVTIEGHCDERGTRIYNLGLGERRATYLKQYFVAHGIDASRIRTISYGKERPSVLGSNVEAWKANRRVVVVLDSRRLAQ